MRLVSRPVPRFGGETHVPGDKSISHRSLILGALADGETRITGLLEGDDVLATAAAVRAFGASAARTAPGAWRVRGARWSSPTAPIDCGNSGTGVRLLMGAAAGFPLTATFTGDASLRGRPMRRVTGPLATMGARVDGDHLPITLTGGGLTGIAYTSPVASAQVKSALLLAGLNANGPTRVTEPQRSRDHSERMLRAFGAHVADGPAQGEGWFAEVTPGRLTGRAVAVPGDPSSAAFPLVAALIAATGNLELDGVLLNPLRTGLLDALVRMGAALTVEQTADDLEPVGRLHARPGPLSAIETAAHAAPAMIDEFPILAVAAAFARGTTVMRGLAELRVKESDRIALTAAGLRACGVVCEDGPDWLAVHGCGGPPPGGAQIETHGDHRIAMSFLVLGSAARAPVAVDRADMIATSFPGFVDLMNRLGADIGEAA